MADRPIIFSAPMVQALLAGRKSQTRRVLKPRRKNSLFDGTWRDGYVLDPGNAAWRAEECPAAPGDRLYVRERAHIDGSVANYAADMPAGMDLTGLYYRPSIHMPRWASRLTLVVSEVRVQRLLDINDEDAEAEGACDFAEQHERISGKGLSAADRPPRVCQTYGSRTQAFQYLWETIHGADAWNENPWVAAISFCVHRANIDTLPADTLEPAGAA